MTLTARAWNTLDVIGQAGPFTVTLTSINIADNIAPQVRLSATSSDRLEVQDPMRVEVSSVDNNQGTGIARTGYTVLGISPTRGDTVYQSQEVNFGSSPRTGTVTQNWDVLVFNADPLALPDTMVYEFFGWAVDNAGNCAASVGDPQLVSLVCGLQAGNLVANQLTGQRLTRIIVSGRTVLLPTGGKILDAVMDTIRRKLYLSNIDRDRIEIFRLEDEQFETSAAVGSEPWGLTLNRGEDTLLVANSGGTNISMVYLGAAVASTTDIPVEDPGRRLLTPDVVLFDVEQALDDVGNISYKVTYLPNAAEPGFTDRPQFVAVDSTGRVLYSTKTELLGDFGTLRKAKVPLGMTEPEVKIFVEHADMLENAAFVGIAHVDNVYSVSTAANDSVRINDHTPGNRTNLLTGFDGSPAQAAAAVAGLGSDVLIRTGQWSVENVGFHDTTYVSASGNGGWVVFGEGSRDPVGRIIMYEANADTISGAIAVDDLLINGSETVRGIGLNYDGTLGVALGSVEASFFSTDLRLQGSSVVAPGASGAVLHPLHANSKSVDNPTGLYQPDTHLAFVGSGDKTIDIIDTFHFFVSGKLYIKDLPSGPLKAVLPFPGDNAGLACATRAVQDQVGATIGQAVEIFQGGNFNLPHPASGGPTEDACIVVKLVGITDVGGVVVVDVRKSDVLRLHPSRN